MLKICTGSLKEGIKELSKFKSKLSFINLISNESGVYLTKVYQRNDKKLEVITYELDAESKENNNYQLSDKMIKAISKINETYLTFELEENNKLKVYSEKRKLDFIIEGYEFKEEIISFESKESFSVKGEELKILFQTIDFVSKDEVRPILQGINFKNNKVCALDGYRVALRECSTMNLENSYTVHNEPLKVINSLIKKDSEVKISFNENMCKIELNKLKIYSGLMDGTYINYESLIPQEYNINATFGTAELKEELDFMLSLVDSGKSPLLKMDITQNETNLKGYESDSSSIIKLNDAKADGEILIAFNTNYIKEMLKHFTDKVTLKFTSAISPVVCQYEDLKGLDLVLPVRLPR
jgi:DNA polymerase-3 subunit beta